MHAVHTFIVRLLVNLEKPGDLHGSVQTIPEREMYSFQNGSDLLVVLDQLVRSEAGETPHPCSSVEHTPRDPMSKFPP